MLYKMDLAHPGSNVTTETTVTLAASSIVFHDADPICFQRLLDRAIKEFEFTDECNNSLHVAMCLSYCDYSSHQDELLWNGSVVLPAVTLMRKYSHYYLNFVPELNVPFAAADCGNSVIFGTDKVSDINSLRSLCRCLMEATMVIRDYVEPLLDDYGPPGISSRKFSRLSLGTVPPNIEGILGSRAS